MSQSNIATLIDAYGQLKLQMAELERQEKKLKEELKTLGEGPHEGDRFILTITDSVRETLDMEAVREKLSAQFIRAHTKETPVRTLRAKVRTQVEED